MAFGEFYVERQGWARWPKVLIMCRKRGHDVNGREIAERKRYIPETTLTRCTCTNASRYAGRFKCSLCEAEWDTEDVELAEPTLWIGGVGDYPRFCQGCGARIEEAR